MRVRQGAHVKPRPQDPQGEALHQAGVIKVEGAVVKRRTRHMRTASLRSLKTLAFSASSSLHSWSPFMSHLSHIIHMCSIACVHMST